MGCSRFPERLFECVARGVRGGERPVHPPQGALPGRQSAFAHNTRKAQQHQLERRARLHLREEVRSWTYLKFPYIASRGRDAGWYRVGPLARVNNADSITTPLAEAERVRLRGPGGAAPVSATLGPSLINLLRCRRRISWRPRCAPDN